MGKASPSSWRIEVERVTMKGKPRYLWKAVDEAGEMLDFYATEEPDEQAARQFFRKSLAGTFRDVRLKKPKKKPPVERTRASKPKA